MIFVVRFESPFLHPHPGFAHLAVSSATARLLGSEWRSEGSPLAGAINRATTLYPVGPRDPNHDAVIRIGSEAPKRRTHSSSRHESQGALPGFRHLEPSSAPIPSGRNRPKLSRCLSTSFVHCAGRKTTPSGTTPSRTSRQRAIRN